MFRLIDSYLRRRQHILEFWDDPRCLFRIRLCRAERALPVARGEIPAGTALVELHYWNEHLPRVPRGGPNLAWAAKIRRMLFVSLVELARRLDEAAELQSVEGVFAVSTFLSPEDARTGQHVLERLGFSCTPYRNPLGRLRDFWEKVYVRLLNRTFRGRGGTRARSLRELRRVLAWISREELVERYAVRRVRQRPAPSEARAGIR